MSENSVKCYPVSTGYMGLVSGQWMLFATESEYYEYAKGDISNDIHLEDRISPNVV